MEIETTRELTSEFMSIMYRMRLLGKKKHFESEISPAEFCAIIAIAKYNKKEEGKDQVDITVSELVEKLGSSLPAVSKLLRSIEQKGLIERTVNHSDRRVTNIVLSDEGKKLLDQQIKARDAMMEHIVQEMGEENMRMLLTQMQNLYTILKSEVEEH